MFYQIVLEKYITIPSYLLDKNLKVTIYNKLIESVEGQCSGVYGFVISVLKVFDQEMECFVKDGSGDVLVKVMYKAMVFKPSRKQVMDAVVNNITKECIFFNVGPLEGCIGRSDLPEDMDYDSEHNEYCSKDGNCKIRIESEIRFRILNMLIEADQMKVIGTMGEDGLGVLK
jgi:DNA-directed RNA polymerase subunit E'/Rpb7